MKDASLAAEGSQSPRRRRRFALPLALVVGSLLVSELAARVLLAVIGMPYDAESARHRLQLLAGKFDARELSSELVAGAEPAPLGDVVQQPYVGWEYIGMNDRIAEDAAYFRTPRALDAFDVYLFGGSVGQGLSIASDRMAMRLTTDPRFAGRDVVIHNYAHAAYKQPQQAMLLCYLLNVGHQPDAVIEVDGFNEVALGWNNAVGHVHPLHPDSTYWGSTARGQRLGWPLVERLHAAKTTQEAVDEFGALALSTGMWRSSVLGTFALRRMSALKRASYAAYEDVQAQMAESGEDPVMHGPPFAPGTIAGFGLIVRAWEQSSRIMHGICEEHAIPYLHVLQPTLFDAGSKPLTAAEIATSATPDVWVEGVRLGYPLLRLGGARLNAAGVPFFDASGVFRDVAGDLYFDGCHFGIEGNQIFCDAIAAAFLDSLAAGR